MLPATAAHAAAPTVEALAPGAVRFDRALLGARVNAGGEATTYRVEYGTTTDYGSTAPAGPGGNAGSESILVLRNEPVTRLTPETTYHYRVVATNATETVEGADRTFRTPAAPRSGAERAYEMVSPVEKNGLGLFFTHTGADESGFSIFPGAVNRDGNRAVFASWGAYEGATSGHLTTYESDRTEQGWVTKPVSPPVRTLHSMYTGANEVYRTTRDLDGYAIETFDFIDPADTNGIFDIYSRSDEASTFERASIGNNGEQQVATSGSIAVADHGRAVLFYSEDELIPGTGVPGTRQLYLRRRGQTFHVSERPTGGPLTETSEVQHTAEDRVNQLAPLSDDGTQVTFSSGGQVYHWTLGEGTQWVSEPDPGFDPPNAPEIVRSSRDGSRVVFYSSSPLTADAPANTDGFYEWQRTASGGELRYRGRGVGADPNELQVEDGGGMFASEDLSAIYYQVLGFGEGMTSARSELRRLTDDGVTVVANSGPDYEFANYWVIEAIRGDRQVHVAPDGDSVLFASKRRLTAYDNAGRRMYYLWREGQGLSCVTCRPDGKPPAGQAAVSLGQGSLISDDGSRAMFSTRDPLVPQDRNGRYDVYEWHDGAPQLVSSGQSPADSYPVGMSASGRDAIFATAESLVWQDRDGGDLDFYDARIGGGFGPAPAGPPAPCAGDTCQGAVPTAPAPGGAAGSESFRGSGNVEASKTKKTTVTATVVRPAGSAVTRLSVRVSGAGRISASGSSVSVASRSVKRAGQLHLRVVLSVRGREALRKRGMFSTRVRVVFRATDGGTAQRTVTVTFKRPAKGGR